MGKKKFVVEDYDFRLYVNCPECGRLILRSEDTDNSDIPCLKCGALLNVSVNNGEMVITKVVKPSKRRIAALNEYKRRISSTFASTK